MAKIITFQKFNLDEIDMVYYTQEKNHLICRFTTYDGFKQDFILADATTKQFQADRLQRLIKFMASFGMETEKQITCDNNLYHYPTESRVYGIINSFYRQVKIKQICMKYGFTYNPNSAVISDDHLGSMVLYDLITDYHGKLKKCVGKDCAKELIDFYDANRAAYANTI